MFIHLYSKARQPGSALLESGLRAATSPLLQQLRYVKGKKGREGRKSSSDLPAEFSSLSGNRQTETLAHSLD